jgi:predicted transcriptional regulator
MYFETLPPAIEHATVGDVAHRRVLICGPDTPLRSIASTMAANRVHSIVVREAPRGANGWGLISDFTIVEALADGKLDAMASDVAGPPVVIAEADMPVRDAVPMMREAGATHLLLFEDGSEDPVGVVSALDVAATWVWGLG